MITRGRYVHKPMVKFSRASWKIVFFCVCNFLKILMVSDKTIHNAFRIHKILSTKPIKEISFSLFTKSIPWLWYELQEWTHLHILESIWEIWHSFYVQKALLVLFSNLETMLAWTHSMQGLWEVIQSTLPKSKSHKSNIA